MPILLVLAVMGVALAGDPQRRGDVMGRDLNYLAFEKLGHLGIFTGRDVLECLNEPQPIQKNSVSSFKQLTRFWGARYIPGDYDFRRVIAKGWRQRQFEPGFTLSPVHTVGRYINKRVWNRQTGTWEVRTVLVPARFRCDTFVWYSFKAGIGYRLGEGDPMPAVVFLNCPKAR